MRDEHTRLHRQSQVHRELIEAMCQRSQVAEMLERQTEETDERRQLEEAFQRQTGEVERLYEELYALIEWQVWIDHPEWRKAKRARSVIAAVESEAVRRTTVEIDAARRESATLFLFGDRPPMPDLNLTDDAVPGRTPPRHIIDIPYMPAPLKES